MKPLRPILHFLLAGAFLWIWFIANISRIDTALSSYMRNVIMTNGIGKEFAKDWQNHATFTDPDSYCWLIYTRQSIETGAWRIRHTEWDNAPYGREMHWSNLPIWCLRGLAKIFTTKDALPLQSALERAGQILLPLLAFISFFATFSLILRRWGALCAWIFLLAVTTAPLLYFHFHPTRPDHHGFQIVFLLAAIYCLTAGNFGWRNNDESPKNSRHLFALAGFWTACLIWMSATVFLFVMLGISGGLALTFFKVNRSDEHGLFWDGALWALWARMVAAFSFIFYLLEYAPRHFSWHLEPNHPLYALLLLGISYCLPTLGALWLGQLRFSKSILWRLILSAIPILLLPCLIVWRGGAFHALSTSTMQLMHQTILEFTPPLLLAKRSAIQPLAYLFSCLAFFPLFTVVGLVLGLRTKHSTPFNLTLIATSGLALVFLCLALWQIRWASMACLFGALNVVVLVSWSVRSRATYKRACLLAITIPLLGAAGFFIHDICLETRHIAEVTKANHFAHTALHHRIQAIALRDALKADPPPRLYAPIAMGPVLEWFSAGHVLGSLYWENLQGMSDFYIASLDAAPDAPTAQAILQNRGITHIVKLISRNIAKTEIRTANADLLETRLLTGTNLPVWLVLQPTIAPALCYTETLIVPAINAERGKQPAVTQIFDAAVWRVAP